LQGRKAFKLTGKKSIQTYREEKHSDLQGRIAFRLAGKNSIQTCREE
jgi:hypothetical protein